MRVCISEGQSFPNHNTSNTWKQGAAKLRGRLCFSFLSLFSQMAEIQCTSYSSLPPSQSGSWEHVLSAWIRRHTRAAAGSRMYKKNVVHCSLAGFVLCCFWWGSLYSSLHSFSVDVSCGTFFTGSKHLKVPFICYLIAEGWIFQPQQQKANSLQVSWRVSKYLCDHIN